MYYLMGEEFDRDPFLIFKLRGMEREELIGLMGGVAAPEGKAARKKATRDEAGLEREPAPVPLPNDPDSFWGKEGTRENICGEVRIPRVAAAPLKRLGNFPFWRGEESLTSALESIYREATVAGMDVFLGQQEVGK